MGLFPCAQNYRGEIPINYQIYYKITRENCFPETFWVISKSALTLAHVLLGQQQNVSVSDQEFHDGIVQLRSKCFDGVVLPRWMDTIG
jgi:hypothetical protein